MAIEFGSRKETFDNFKVYETMLAGRPFKVEMGKMCGLSNASALIRYGETCVMCNVVMSPKPREGVDFFPLNVEYEEKLYAAGRIPGSFMRREGRPGERAILTSRVVDRPMRPLFPKEMRNDVCITMTVMSLDPDCSPEIAGMIGASLVTAVSDIPWNGPIGGVQVGLVDGEIVLNPTQEQRKVSDLALTVAATMDKIVMIEAGANEVDEDTMLNAIKAAHVEIKRSSSSSTRSWPSAASRRSTSRWWVWTWTCSTPSRTSTWTTSRLLWTPTTRTCVTQPCCPSWTRSPRNTPTCPPPIWIW